MASKTFKEIEDELRRRHGDIEADQYREHYKANNHWEDDRVFSTIQADDGVGFPIYLHAQEVFHDLQNEIC